MIYAAPILLLLLTIALFFIAGRRGYVQFGGWQIALQVVVALPLLLSGIVLHFVRAAGTASIVPPGFPDPRLLVILSGIFEVAGAIGLFIPRFRKLAGALIAVLMVAIFPANIYVAGQSVGGMQMPSVPVRTAMQIVYILLVLIASFGFPRKART